MTATITATNGAGTVTPLMILSTYAATSGGRNVVHSLIGGGLAVSLVGSDPRSGTFDAFFTVEADAWACLALHREPTTFTLTDTDVPAVNMTYAVNGDVVIALDENTASVWTVSIGYQEVTAGSVL